MIPRYSRPEMVAIWSPETRFRIWFEIEAHACDAQAALGVIPKENAAAVWRAQRRRVRRRPDRRDRGRDQARRHRLPHPSRRTSWGDEARFVHQGMTSSDVLDTCLNDPARPRRRHPARRPRRAARRPEDAAPSSTRTPSASAAATASMPSRRPSASTSRGSTPRFAPQPRPPRAARGRRSRPARSPAPSAPSPTSTPRWRSTSAAMMGLTPEPISTQVIPRDRHAMFFATLGVIAALDRAHRDRDPPPAAHRGAGGRGVSSRPARRAPPPCRTSATRC